MAYTTEWRIFLLFLILVLRAEAEEDPMRYYIDQSQTLHDDLFGNITHETYNKKVIPILGRKGTLPVPVKIYTEVLLTKISDLDSVNQAITTQVWIRMRWFDPRLKWNPNDYGGVTYIQVSPDYGQQLFFFPIFNLPFKSFH